MANLKKRIWFLPFPPDNQIDKYDRKLIAVGTRLNIIDVDPPRHPFPSYRSVHREQQ